MPHRGGGHEPSRLGPPPRAAPRDGTGSTPGGVQGVTRGAAGATDVGACSRGCRGCPSPPPRRLSRSPVSGFARLCPSAAYLRQHRPNPRAHPTAGGVGGGEGGPGEPPPRVPGPLAGSRTAARPGPVRSAPAARLSPSPRCGLRQRAAGGVGGGETTLGGETALGGGDRASGTLPRPQALQPAAPGHSRVPLRPPPRHSPGRAGPGRAAALVRSAPFRSAPLRAGPREGRGLTGAWSLGGGASPAPLRVGRAPRGAWPAGRGVA